MSKIKKEKIENDICVYYIFPKAGIQIKGVVFVPPLIGGSYLEQYTKNFSQIGEAGYIFVSFNYKGHKGSTGKFTLENSMEDSLTVVNHIKNQFDNYNIFAIGACYGSIPLLYSLYHNAPFKKIAIINAISNIKQAINFLLIIKIIFFRLIKFKKVSADKILSDITKKLFPNIDQNEKRFGLLKYKNVDFLKIFSQCISTDFTKKIYDLNTPVLCCYGTKDKFLGFNKEKNRLLYENQMKQYFNQLDFLKIDTDHFFNNSKVTLNKKIIDFFEH